MHLVWAGLVAVFAISIGAAIMASALAAVSVYAGKSAIALASPPADEARWITRMLEIVAMLGGIIFIFLRLG